MGEERRPWGRCKQDTNGNARTKGIWPPSEFDLMREVAEIPLRCRCDALCFAVDWFAAWILSMHTDQGSKTEPLDLAL